MHRKMKTTARTTLGEVRKFVRKHLKEGIDCPACTRHAHSRPHPMGRTEIMTLAMVASQKDWIGTHARLGVGMGVTSLSSLLRHGLVKQPRKRSGVYVLTAKGRAFLFQGKGFRHHRVFDGRTMEVIDGKKPITLARIFPRPTDQRTVQRVARGQRILHAKIRAALRPINDLTDVSIERTKRALGRAARRRTR